MKPSMSQHNGCLSTKIDTSDHNHTPVKMSSTIVRKPEFSTFTVSKGALKSKLIVPKECAVRTVEIDISDETFRPIIMIKHRGVEIEINYSDIMLYKGSKRTVLRKDFKKYCGNGTDDEPQSDDDDNVDSGKYCSSDCDSSDSSDSGISSASSKTVAKVDSGKQCSSRASTASCASSVSTKSSVSSSSSGSKSSASSVSKSSVSKSSDNKSSASSTQDKKPTFTESKFKTPVYGNISKKDFKTKPSVAKDKLVDPCYIAIAGDDIVNVSSNGDVTRICTAAGLHKAVMFNDDTGIINHIALQVREENKVYDVLTLHYLQFDHGAMCFHYFEPSINGVLDGVNYTEMPSLIETKTPTNISYNGKFYKINNDA